MKNMTFKKLRLKSGLSQRDVANKLGLKSGQYISNFERGICYPSHHTWEILAKLYNVDRELIEKIIIRGKIKNLKNRENQIGEI